MSRPSSYRIRRLTSGVSDRPQNIALVSGQAPAESLRVMFDKVHGSPDTPYNAAIWLDVPSLNEEQCKELANWAKGHGMNIQPTKARALRKIFSEAARKGTNNALEPFRQHIEGRLRDLAQAFPEKEARVTIRAEKLRGGDTGGNLHLDGGNNTQERFIETLYGGATCLVDDRQVLDRKGVDARLADEEITLWQPPEGALSLLTTRKNAAKPVVHAPPPKTGADAGNVRVVVIYDLYDRKKPVLEQIKALFA